MSAFKNLANDAVCIVNADGIRSDSYKALVNSHKGKVTIFESELDVEPGWKLIRPLPNGKEESYTILETHYQPGARSHIPPSWSLDLRKDASMLNKPKTPRTTTITINNSEGIQIGDHNVQHIEKSLIGLIEKINSSDISETEKSKAKGVLKQLMLNPTIAGILGGATSGLLALLG